MTIHIALTELSSLTLIFTGLFLCKQVVFTTLYTQSYTLMNHESVCMLRECDYSLVCKMVLHDDFTKLSYRATALDTTVGAKHRCE
jgi:hypothetical protein